jgi:hypothetical protein
MAPSNTHAPGLHFVPAVLWAGLIAGSLMLAIVALPGIFAGGDTLGAPRMIGALVVDRDASTLTTTFILVSVAGHFFLSVLFAFILALLVHRMNTLMAVATGAAYGIGLYLINFFVMATAFPWFAEFRNLTNFVSHLAFGMIAAWAYKRLRAPKARADYRPAIEPRQA